MLYMCASTPKGPKLLLLPYYRAYNFMRSISCVRTARAPRQSQEFYGLAASAFCSCPDDQRLLCVNIQVYMLHTYIHTQKAQSRLYGACVCVVYVVCCVWCRRRRRALSNGVLMVYEAIK